MTRTIVIYFLFIGLFAVGSCRKKSAKLPTSDKAALFHRYNESLDRCKRLPVDSLLQCAEEAFSLKALENVDTLIWRSYGKAKALIHNHDDLDAVQIINQSLEETQREELPFEEAEFYHLRGDLYANRYENLKATSDLFKAADLYLRLGLKQQASACYLNIGNLQYNSGNYRLAIENGRYAIALIEENEVLNHRDSVALMNVHNTLGLAYYMLDHFDSAIVSYASSYSLAKALNDEFWQGLVRGNQGIIYYRQGKMDIAKERFRHDIATSIKYRDWTSAANSLINMAEISMLSGAYENAKQYYDSAFLFVNRVNEPTLKQRYFKVISDWHRQTKDYHKAFFYYEKHVALSDSLEGIMTRSKLEKIQDENQLEKHLSNLNLLKTENELKAKEIRFSRISNFAFSVIFVLLVGLLVAIRKNNKNLSSLNFNLEEKVRERTHNLKKINEELDTFLYRVSHDVRRPILSIIGLSQVADLVSDKKELEGIHQHIKNTANEMDSMLKKLQMAYELQKQRERMLVNLNTHLEGLIEDFGKQYPSATFHLKKDNNAVVKTNMYLLDIVLENILENACVFSEKAGQTISVTLNLSNMYVTIAIRDNGVGIDPKHLEDIFKAYTRFNPMSKGSGLGLYLAHKAVEKINGKITVRSEKGVTEFVVSVPINQPILS